MYVYIKKLKKNNKKPDIHEHLTGAFFSTGRTNSVRYISKGYNVGGLLWSSFTYVLIFCFVVATCDLVHDVKTKFDIP